jgi:biotin transport system permease protein
VVSATTRTTALVDALVALLRPLRPLGVDPDRVALLLALSVRAVPVPSGREVPGSTYGPSGRRS